MTTWPRRSRHAPARRAVRCHGSRTELIHAGMRDAREGEQPAHYEPPTFDTGRPLVDVTDVAVALEVLDRGS